MMDALASISLLELLTNCSEPHVVVSINETVWKNAAAEHVQLTAYDIKQVNQKLSTVSSAVLTLSNCGNWQATRASKDYVVLREEDSFETLDVILERHNWPMSDLILSHKWEETRFGCLRGWSKTLRDAVVQCLNSEWSACLWIRPGENFLQDLSNWPPEDAVNSYYAIYNEGYTKILGCHHPAALGENMNITWGAPWAKGVYPFVEDMLHHDKKAVMFPSATFIVEGKEDGRKDELILDWHCAPIFQDDQSTIGAFAYVIDVTERELAKRRLECSQSLAAKLSAAADLDDVYTVAIEALGKLPLDLPLVMLYSCTDSQDPSLQAHIKQSRIVDLRLRGTLGIEKGHYYAPTSIVESLDQPTENTNLPWPVSDALCSPTMISLLHDPKDPTYPLSSVVDGWGDSITHTVVMAEGEASRLPSLVMVVGTNSRSTYDEPYRAFLRSILDHIESAARAAQKKQVLHRMLTLANQSPLGLLEWDTTHVVYANARWRELSGCYVPLPIPLEYIKTIFHVEDKAKLQEYMVEADVMSTAGDAMLPIEFSYNNGTIVLATTIKHTPNSMSFLTDISASKLQDQKLVEIERKRADQNEAARREQEALSAVLHHEIRNPLNAVSQASQLLSTSFESMERIRQALIAHSANRGDPVVSDLLADLDVELQQCADMATSIHLSSRHQAIIASDILERSRLSNGLLGINTTDFNLLEEMQAIIRLYDCQARSAEIHLSLQAGTSICASTRMRSDITRIIQILSNLLSNALKFLEMKDGLRVCTVHIDLLDAAPTYERSTPALNAAESICSPETKYFSVSVKDNGVGISDAEINSLFTKFNTLGRRNAGTGLGLYLCRKLCHLLGGEITVKSTPGQGTTFLFFIRVELAALWDASSTVSPKPAPIATPPLRTSCARPILASSPSFNAAPVSPKARSHVLVVEDNAIGRKLLVKQLQRRGYNVSWATNGQEALDLISAQADISAVLCDIEMPVKDGLQCVREVREKERQVGKGAPLPFCAITGNALPEQINVALSAGYSSYLTKPYQLDAIVSWIEAT